MLIPEQARLRGCSDEDLLIAFARDNKSLGRYFLERQV